MYMYLCKLSVYVMPLSKCLQIEKQKRKQNRIREKGETRGNGKIKTTREAMRVKKQVKREITGKALRGSRKG